MENILECSNLFKYYSGKPALYNLNVSFPKGKIIGLLGPNGSGKTTLIKIVAGLLTPSSGTVTINGMKPGVETKNMISYLPERQYFSSWMTVNDILTVFNEFYTDFDIARARDMMQRLGITPENKIKTLSKGTKEKVQLVLVMSRRAKLYLLDEPIGGVDPAARDYILDTIISNYSENAAMLISTHLITDVEKILDGVVFIDRGSIVLSATVDEIREKENKSVDALFREVFKC